MVLSLATAALSAQVDSLKVSVDSLKVSKDTDVLPKKQEETHKAEAKKPYFSFKNGLGFATPDSSYSVNIRFRIQSRFLMTTVSDEDFSPSGWRHGLGVVDLALQVMYTTQNGLTMYSFLFQREIWIGI